MAISRRTLIERVDRFIRSIENRKGEPDHWEGHCTLQVLADVDEGHVERAEAKLILAKTPPDLRVAQDSMDVPPDRRGPTAAQLRVELERIKSQVLTG
jgi:hypothetical protein